MGTSILLSLGLVLAVAMIAVSAFIVYATLMRIVRDRIARRNKRHRERREAAGIDREQPR